MAMVQRGCESNGTKGGDLPARLLITILIPSTCRGEMRPTLINSLPRVREICNCLERKRVRVGGGGGGKSAITPRGNLLTVDIKLQRRAVVFDAREPHRASIKGLLIERNAGSNFASQ